jgi:hypothetical protein
MGTMKAGTNTSSNCTASLLLWWQGVSMVSDRGATINTIKMSPFDTRSNEWIPADSHRLTERSDVVSVTNPNGIKVLTEDNMKDNRFNDVGALGALIAVGTFLAVALIACGFH